MAEYAGYPVPVGRRGLPPGDFQRRAIQMGGFHAHICPVCGDGFPDDLAPGGEVGELAMEHLMSHTITDIMDAISAQLSARHHVQVEFAGPKLVTP